MKGWAVFTDSSGRRIKGFVVGRPPIKSRDYVRTSEFTNLSEQVVAGFVKTKDVLPPSPLRPNIYSSILAEFVDPTSEMYDLALCGGSRCVQHVSSNWRTTAFELMYGKNDLTTSFVCCLQDASSSVLGLTARYVNIVQERV